MKVLVWCNGRKAIPRGPDSLEGERRLQAVFEGMSGLQSQWAKEQAATK
jgi:hypothetical protein